MSGTYDFYFGQPWWLLACALVVPVIWLARRSLTGLGRTRRILAVALRILVVLLLVILLARPILAKKGTELTLVAVMDRSQSVPQRILLTSFIPLVGKFLLSQSQFNYLPGLGRLFSSAYYFHCQP